MSQLKSVVSAIQIEECKLKRLSVVLKKIDWPVLKPNNNSTVSGESFMSYLGLGAAKNISGSHTEVTISKTRSKPLGQRYASVDNIPGESIEDCNLYDIDICSPLGQRIYRHCKCRNKASTSKALDSNCNRIVMKDRKLRSTSAFGLERWKTITITYRQRECHKNLERYYKLKKMKESEMRTCVKQVLPKLHSPVDVKPCFVKLALIEDIEDQQQPYSKRDQISSDYDSGVEVESINEQSLTSVSSKRSPLGTHNEQNLVPLKIQRVGNTYACMSKDLKHKMKVRRSKAERSLAKVLNQYTMADKVANSDNKSKRFTFFWEDLAQDQPQCQKSNEQRRQDIQVIDLTVNSEDDYALSA